MESVFPLQNSRLWRTVARSGFRLALVRSQVRPSTEPAWLSRSDRFPRADVPSLPKLRPKERVEPLRVDALRALVLMPVCPQEQRRAVPVPHSLRRDDRIDA